MPPYTDLRRTVKSHAVPLRALIWKLLFVVFYFSRSRSRSKSEKHRKSRKDKKVSQICESAFLLSFILNFCSFLFSQDCSQIFSPNGRFARLRSRQLFKTDFVVVLNYLVQSKSNPKTRPSKKVKKIARSNSTAARFSLVTYYSNLFYYSNPKSHEQWAYAFNLFIWFSFQERRDDDKATEGGKFFVVSFFSLSFFVALSPYAEVRRSLIASLKEIECTY